MDNVKELLTNALNPQARLMAETRGLLSKWDKTGLLEGLRSDIDKSNMSVLLENQAKQLIEDNGGKVTSSVSKNVQYVLVGEDAGSNLYKAKKLGIPTMSEEEFKKMVE